MKIICENCQAKYSISDEKIRGKVFKIQCKKCTEPIIVRGDKIDGDSDEHENEPMDSFTDDEYEARESMFGNSDPPKREDALVGTRAEPVWFILLDGEEQQGPYTAELLHEYLADGTMDKATYVWKEGFADWLPYQDVVELQPPSDGDERPSSPFQRPSTKAAKRPPGTRRNGLFDAPKPASASSSGLFDSDSSGLFGNKKKTPAPTGSPFKSAGLFDSSSADKSNGMFSEAAAAAATAAMAQTSPARGLFEPAPRPQNGGLFASVDDQPAPQPAIPAANPGLTGQRNESSVLFSLSNLQQLAANPAPQKQASWANAPTPGSEASGLIDIRTLASALKDETESSVEDLLSLGPGGFSQALNAPVLTASSSGLPKPVLFGLIGGGVLILSLLVILIVALVSDDSGETDPKIAQLLAELEQIKKQQPDGAAVNLDTRKQLEKREQELKAEIQQRKAAAANEETGKAVASRSPEKDRGRAKEQGNADASSRNNRPSRSPRQVKSSPNKASASKNSPNTKKSGKPAHSELDDLLGVSSKKKAAKKQKQKSSAPSGGGKESLSRSDVKNGMAAVASRVKQCGRGENGTITLKVVISPSGRVVSAAPSGSFSGTSVGSCAARAVKAARFPRFSGSSLTVRYPFRL